MAAHLRAVRIRADLIRVVDHERAEPEDAPLDGLEHGQIGASRGGPGVLCHRGHHTMCRIS